MFVMHYYVKVVAVARKLTVLKVFVVDKSFTLFARKVIVWPATNQRETPINQSYSERQKYIGGTINAYI